MKDKKQKDLYLLTFQKIRISRNYKVLFKINSIFECLKYGIPQITYFNN